MYLCFELPAHLGLMFNLFIKEMYDQEMSILLLTCHVSRHVMGLLIQLC